MRKDGLEHSHRKAGLCFILSNFKKWCFDVSHFRNQLFWDCLKITERVEFIKEAKNSFQHFPRRRFWWVIITTLYQLMLQSWYQKTAQSLVNTLVLFSSHNRLPQQQYDLLKTPLILALSANNSKTSSVTPIFYYRIVISMIRCNFLQSLKKFCERGSEPP